MHAIFVFLACAIIFGAAVYGILRLYASQNDGYMPWQGDAPVTPPSKPGKPGTPPKPK